MANESRRQRHLIAPEFPPQMGGVSDYTSQVAEELAQEGEEVHVWCPECAGALSRHSNVSVHRDLGRISPADLLRVGRQLDRFPAPRRILVQWVPHGFRYHSMNVPFCFWLWSRAAFRGDKVEIMVHEPFLAFGEGSWRQALPALVHRVMTIVLLRAAERVWVSIPEWERGLRPYALGKRLPFQWLPIPSNIPVLQDASRVETIRRRYGPEDGVLIGHFGTFGRPVTSLLEPILLKLGADLSSRRILLIGAGSDSFRDRIIRLKPQLTPYINATGSLSQDDISHHIAACDLLVQPYPDGVSSRRTSVMAGLSHSRPILTTTGHLTESFWEATEAVALAPAGDEGTFIRLLNEICAQAGRRASMGEAAGKLYFERFDICHTIRGLRDVSPEEYATCAS